MLRHERPVNIAEWNLGRQTQHGLFSGVRKAVDKYSEWNVTISGWRGLFIISRISLGPKTNTETAAERAKYIL